MTTDHLASLPTTFPASGGAAGLPGRNSLEGYDLLHLLGVLAAAGQSGALKIARAAEAGAAPQQFSIWLQEGRVRQAQGPYNLSGPAALAELLRRPEGSFYFKAAEMAPAANLNLSTDSFGYQALLLLPPPPLPFMGAARLMSLERLEELGLTLQEAECLQDIDLGMPLIEATDTPEAQHFVARLLKLGLLTRRKLRVARVMVRLTHAAYDKGFIDEAIYQSWCKVKGEKQLTAIQMRLDSGQEYLLPIAPRKNLGAVVQLSPDVLIRTGLSVGDAVLLRPEPFAE